MKTVYVQVCMRIDFAEKNRIVLKVVTMSQGSEWKYVHEGILVLSVGN